MSTSPTSRRRFVTFASGVPAVLLVGGRPDWVVAAEDKGKAQGSEKEVGAVEDLMREHGVLRRALLVYRECAGKLRVEPAKVDPAAIRQTAMLFRTFGEDYHERKLEEAYIFPAVRKTGAPAGSYVDTLIAQHRRGREITDYILAVVERGAIGTADAEPLARSFEAMDLMYQNHAAREDTVVFPAWKDGLSERQLDEMGDKFEEIERQQFGKDGFDDAVRQMAQIEKTLGLADLSQFTAPPPGPRR